MKRKHRKVKNKVIFLQRGAEIEWRRRRIKTSLMIPYRLCYMQPMEILPIVLKEANVSFPDFIDRRVTVFPFLYLVD